MVKSVRKLSHVINDTEDKITHSEMSVSQEIVLKQIDSSKIQSVNKIV